MPYSAASVVENPRMLMPAWPRMSATSARRPLRFSRNTVSCVTFTTRPPGSATAARPSSNARRLTSRILAGTAASRPRRHCSSLNGRTVEAAPSSATLTARSVPASQCDALGVHGHQADAAQRGRSGQVVRVVLLAAQHAARRDARGVRADQRAPRRPAGRGRGCPPGARWRSRRRRAAPTGDQTCSPKRTVLSTLPPRCAMPLTSLALTSRPAPEAVSARIAAPSRTPWPPTPTMETVVVPFTTRPRRR